MGFIAFKMKCIVDTDVVSDMTSTRKSVITRGLNSDAHDKVHYKSCFAKDYDGQQHSFTLIWIYKKKYPRTISECICIWT